MCPFGCRRGGIAIELLIPGRYHFGDTCTYLLGLYVRGLEWAPSLHWSRPLMGTSRGSRQQLGFGYYSEEAEAQMSRLGAIRETT